ncbi:MAG: hypothetical protein ABIO45_03695 [Burkholderiaceae bacterium]
MNRHFLTFPCFRYGKVSTWPLTTQEESNLSVFQIRNGCNSWCSHLPFAFRTRSGEQLLTVPVTVSALELPGGVSFESRGTIGADALCR